MSTFTYLKSFIKDKDVASVTPTSRFCIRRVCSFIDFSEKITVVEFGAGAGVFSEYLLKRMTLDSRLILFETNEILFDKLKEIDDPRIELHNKSVEWVEQTIGEGLAGKVDYIISGIPFSFFNTSSKMNILHQSREVLREGGKFLAYQTSGHLKKPLLEVFGNVHTEFELLNIPPMTVYESIKR